MKYKLIVLSLIPLISLAAQNKTAVLAWTDTINPTGTAYNVYRANQACQGALGFNRIASNVLIKSYQDAGLASGSYCYFVKATDGVNESPQSNSATAIVPSSLTAPTLLPITIP